MTREGNFKEQLNGDNKAALQMSAGSSSQVTVAAWEKIFVSLLSLLVEKIADISINRGRYYKGPLKCPYS